MHCADPLAASPFPQLVRPFVLSPNCTVLTLLGPPPSLRLYVLSSLHRNTPCRSSCGLALPSACTSSCLFTEMHCADPLAAPLFPQRVHHLILSPKCTVLTLLRPYFALRKYVLLSVHQKCNLLTLVTALPPQSVRHPVLLVKLLISISLRLSVLPLNIS